MPHTWAGRGSTPDPDQSTSTARASVARLFDSSTRIARITTARVPCPASRAPSQFTQPRYVCSLHRVDLYVQTSSPECVHPIELWQGSCSLTPECRSCETVLVGASQSSPLRHSVMK